MSKAGLENIKSLFEFAKYYDITDFAMQTNEEYEANKYSKIFICVDVQSIWLARILEGYNEDYEQEEGKVLLEREEMDKYKYVTGAEVYRGALRGGIMTLKGLETLLLDDTFENWDITEFNNIDEAIDSLDGGFGFGKFDKYEE